MFGIVAAKLWAFEWAKILGYGTLFVYIYIIRCPKILSKFQVAI